MRTVEFENAVAFAQELIRIPSPPGGEEDVAERVRQEMEALGMRDVRADRFGNVIGVVKGTGGGPTVMLNSHLDVVGEGDHSAWEFPPFSGAVEGGFLHGRGAMDIKGPLAIQSEHVVLVDADLAFGRDSIARVVQGLHEADIAIGNRRHVESRYSVPVRLFGFLYRRHLVGLTFNALVRTAFGLPYRDTQCGLKGFRRNALERLGGSLTIDGFAIDVEILLAARALGLTVTEIPVTVTYESAASSVRLIRSAAAMSTDLLRMLVRRASGRYRRDLTSGGATSPPPGPGPTSAPTDPPRAPSGRR
jgi:hypothetical protein